MTDKQVYKKTFELFNGLCAIYGNNQIHMHHIRYGGLYGDRKTYLGNVIPLCKRHHDLVHTNKEKYMPILIEIINKKWRKQMNKAILMGRLTKDPEVRYTQTTNTLVCTFILAVNRRFAKQGDVQADFINIIAWAKTGEFCSKYFNKGQQVSVVGRIETRNYEDNEGKKHYATDVIAEEVYFADSKKTNAEIEQKETPNQNDDDLPF